LGSAILRLRFLESSVWKPGVLEWAVLENVQCDLQAANRDDHDAGREKELAQAGIPASFELR
jgi:hypothetical protein